MRWAITGWLLLAPLGAAEPGILRVKLRARDGGRIVDMPLDRYVAAVVAGESSTFRSDEALKAMAVAVRTFALRNRSRHAKEGYDVCGTTHCQLLDLNSLTPRFEKAADTTAGEIVWFEGKPAFACYSRDCGGKTEDAQSIWPGTSAPYLRAHGDPYCERAGRSKWQWLAPATDLVNALRRSGLKVPETLDQITVLRRTATGRAQIVSLAGAGEAVPISASALRFAVGRALGWNTVRSEKWEVRGAGGRFLFEGSGAGHGAGLCQTGADQMGVEGHSYREILAEYYPGAVPGITARGLNWSRLGGERVAVMTTQPSRDGGIVQLADRISRSLDLLPGIEIRVYPDVESFRNATSEPGWVAAHTAGMRIHLQPLTGRTLEQTLRHEMVHVLVEERAVAGLPVWFREGLAGYLTGGSLEGRGAAPGDGDVRQKSDETRARRAYSEARQRVAALVARYGEGTVLGWLKRGLPAEVAQASPSKPATKKM
jgi:stage II sporulation protein D